MLSSEAFERRCSVEHQHQCESMTCLATCTVANLLWLMDAGISSESLIEIFEEVYVRLRDQGNEDLAGFVMGA